MGQTKTSYIMLCTYIDIYIYIHNYIYILMCIYRARRIRKLFCQSREPLAFGLCNLSSMWKARRTVHAPSPVWTAGCPALKLCTAASSRTPGAIHNSQEIGALLRKTGHKSLAPANVGSFVRSIPIYIYVYIYGLSGYQPLPFQFVGCTSK